MAAMAIASILVGLLAAFRIIRWRILAWSAGTAAVVFGVASIAFPTYWGSAGRGWGALAVGGGALFILTAGWEARRWRRRARV
jgi:hypothetical protein